MEYQISMFEEPLSWFSENLLKGSGFANSKIRIFAAAINFDKKKFAEYLKEEYGTGGCSIKDGFMDYDSKGLRLRKWKTNYEETYTWSDVAKEIKMLINTDRYLSEQDKGEITEVKNLCHGIPRPVPRTHYPFVIDN